MDFSSPRRLHQMRNRSPTSISFIQTFVFSRDSQLSKRSALNRQTRLRFSKYGNSRIVLKSPVLCTNSSPVDDKAVPQNGKPSSDGFPSFRDVRKILSAISVIGVAETVYLTYNKLFSSPGAICGTQGCLDVLSGPFSAFLGVPLTVFGALAYGIFAYLCIWPLTAKEEEDESEGGEKPTVISADEMYAIRDAATRPLMLAISSAMFTFSAYLMSLLVFVIRSMCPYCVFSAFLSTSLFVLTAFIGRAVSDRKTALKIGAASASFATVCAAALFFLGMPAYSQAQGSGVPQEPPRITLSSDSAAIRTSEKLAKKNTKMYGAFWCTHCYDQKQRFGKQAFSRIPYIECDKNGVNTQYKLCRQKRIPGYPTWEIDGELYPGEIEISELERIADEAKAK